MNFDALKTIKLLNMLKVFCKITQTRTAHLNILASIMTFYLISNTHTHVYRENFNFQLMTSVLNDSSLLSD